MELYSMLFGNAGHGWVQAALLIGMFWAALAHPERIRNVIEFRVAALSLAAAIVTPTMIQLFVLGTQPGGMWAGGGPRMGGIANNDGMGVYAMALPPCFLTLAIILSVDSVTPKRALVREE